MPKEVIKNVEKDAKKNIKEGRNKITHKSIPLNEK